MNRYLLLAALTAAAVVGCRSATPPNQPVPGITPTPRETPVATMPSTRVATRPATLAGRLDEILNRLSDTGAIVAARVIDPETGKELFAQDANRPVTPASNMKLTVTSAALDFFGPDAEFTTDLIVAGNDLYLVGHGDPATGDGAILAAHKLGETSIFDAWADELIAKGYKSLSGNLYYVDNAFESQQTHPDWAADDKTEWYAAPIGGLNYNDNCIDGVLQPGEKGQPGKLELIPATTASVQVINNSVSGDEQTVDWSRAESSNVYTITGGVSKVTKLQSKPVTDPGAFFADALKTRLATKGVTIAGSIARAESAPSGAVVTLQPAKTKFTDVLWRINKNSQNLLAEGTAKKLGGDWTSRLTRPAVPGSWQNAERAIRDFWSRQKIDATGFNFADGSGLSHNNKVTTRLISDILIAMYHHKDFDVFRNSMTIGGVDGTIRNRFKDQPNRVFAKTGYISGVRSLSGYVKNDSGKWLVFSIIYNKIPNRGQGATKPYEELQDEAVLLLMKQ